MGEFGTALPLTHHGRWGLTMLATKPTYCHAILYLYHWGTWSFFFFFWSSELGSSQHDFMPQPLREESLKNKQKWARMMCWWWAQDSLRTLDEVIDGLRGVEKWDKSGIPVRWGDGKAMTKFLHIRRWSYLHPKSDFYFIISINAYLLEDMWALLISITSKKFGSI